MADNATLPATGVKVATDEVTYSGDTADVQLTRLVAVTGAEGSKSVVEYDSTHGLPVAPIAGESHLGAVGGNSIVASGSFTRPANTTAYALGNLIANSTVAGSVTPAQLAAARLAGGTGVIRRIRLSTSNAGLAGTEVVRVHLFRLSPTVANGDGGALSANGLASLALGYTDITLNHLYSDGSAGFASADMIFAAAGGSQNLYALLESRSGFTPVSGATWTVGLEALQD